MEIQNFVLLANLGIAAAFLSMAIAVARYMLVQPAIRAKMGLVLAVLLYLLIACERVIKAMHLPGPGMTDMVIDLLICFVALPLGWVIWPLASHSRTFASIDELEQTREELEHTKHMLETFMNYNPAVTTIKDQDGRYIYVSESFHRRFNIAREHMVGHKDADWLPPEAAKEIRSADLQVWITGSLTATTHHFTLPGENLSHWHVIKFLIPDKAPLLGTIAVDITGEFEAQERLRRNEEIIRLAVNAVKDYAICMLDAEGTVRTWNEGAERTSGYRSEEIIGKNFEVFYPPEGRQQGRPKAEIEVALRNGHFEEQGWRLRKDGSRFWADVTLNAVHDQGGNLQGFIKVTRDLTDHKRLQEELDARYQQLQIARDKALEASSLKSAFVANISHELRTPLAGIIGMNELLLMTELSSEQKELAQTVHESSESLLTIVNNLLDLSKLEAGKLTLEHIPFNVKTLVQDCARLMAAAASSKDVALNITLDQRLPELVVGDPDRLRQILLNLIGNAVKFTPKGEVNIKLTLRSGGKRRIQIRFAVQDTGIGIPDHAKAQLFAPFMQADVSTTRQYGGTGLGLAIAKNLIQNMGGKIAFESRENIGSTFWFDVPFEKGTVAEEKVPAVQLSQQTALANAKVLVVEDNVVLQRLTSRQLANLGVQVDIANCGADAIDMVTARKYDAILMDCHLPTMDGFVATEHIRQLEAERHRRTPIIAVTAGAMSGDKERCLAADMDDYLSKPYTVAQLRTKLVKWVPDIGLAV